MEGEGLIATSGGGSVGDRALDRILVAVDGSAQSRAAVQLAARMAHALHAEITLIHVGRLSEHPLLLSDEETTALEAQSRSVLDASAALCAAAGVAAQRASARGRPAEEILRFARKYQADLIVMGTRGLSGAKSVLMGSVSRVVSQEASCSVVLAR